MADGKTLGEVVDTILVGIVRQSPRSSAHEVSSSARPTRWDSRLDLARSVHSDHVEHRQLSSWMLVHPSVQAQHALFKDYDHVSVRYHAFDSSSTQNFFAPFPVDWRQDSRDRHDELDYGTVDQSLPGALRDACKMVRQPLRQLRPAQTFATNSRVRRIRTGAAVCLEKGQKLLTSSARGGCLKSHIVVTTQSRR